PDRLIGDPGRLRQIVVNLAGNAIKFTERGEVVATVSTEAATGEDVTLHVAIRDTGIGIPPEKQAIIFDAFSQADSSMSRRFGGSGLGLAISMELVARMGGRMWVESEPGTGSIFHFTACFTRQKREPRRLPPGADELRDLPVLVVDDNATNRRILHEMLVSWGMRPVLADSGPSALAELESAVAAGRPFALVLLDGMMPGMDGYTLAERIHEQPHTADLPLMMLSSAGRTRDAVRGEGVGIARSLTKPVKQSVLLDAILDVLEAGESEIDASREPDGEREHGGHALRILLAEDGVVNQKVAVSLLERRGHSVHVAGNGREALSALERESFDLVLMDVQMPEMDGFETTAAIRAREREHGGHLPIIAMTAHAMKGDRERCLAAGMDDYLSKPIRADELYEKVERVSPPEVGDGGTGDAAAHVDEPLATGAPTMTEQPMDWEQALERIGGNEETLWDILEVFLAESPKMMQEIRAATDEGAHAELRRAAHTLKGSAALFVAEPTVRAAQRLESMGETENLEGVESAWTELEAETERLAAALREATARRTSQA
ncbi:MAG: response regulator, partial [Gemmatimonadetes bacterium]|nr:response regulator [Gemmatimonadota bacterium]